MMDTLFWKFFGWLHDIEEKYFGDDKKEKNFDFTPEEQIIADRIPNSIKKTIWWMSFLYYWWVHIVFIIGLIVAILFIIVELGY